MRSLGSFQGNMLTSAFGASIALSIATAYGCAGDSSDRTGGRARGGVAQVRRDAAILALELLDRVERRVAGEERDRCVQSAAGKQHQREPGPGLLIADANGASLVELACPSCGGLASEYAWRRGHRRCRGAGFQNVASCRIIHIRVLPE